MEYVVAFQSAPDCAEAVIRGTMGGHNIVNVLNFYASGGYTQSLLDDLASSVDAFWDTQMLPLLSASYSYVGVDVRGLELVTDLFASNNDGAGGGALSGASTPNNAAFVITHRTNLSGRSARGRTYIGGLASSILLNSVSVSTTWAQDVEDEWEAMRAGMPANGWELVVLSRFSLGAPRPFAIPYVVTECQARNNLLDSQRGRLAASH